METQEFITVVQTISVSAADKMEEEKVRYIE